MKHSQHLNGRPSPVHLRAELSTRLRARRAEIEQAALTRAHAIADPTDADPLYREGLRVAIAIAVDYALEAIERGEERAPPPPPTLLAQSRIAARHGIGLDVVLRRYLAGYGLIGDYLIEEVECSGLHDGSALRRLLRGQAAVLDRLLDAISEEYSREAENCLTSTDQRRAQRVERLLAGEPLDTSELGYDFDAHHIALVASGPDAAEPIRQLSASLDRLLLLVQPDEMTVWAWLCGRLKPDPAELHSIFSSSWPNQGVLALGEPADGVAGWRLSHRQAKAALPIVERSSDRVVRYADVALIASMLKDDLLATSLRRLYLEPLRSDRAGRATLRETASAYFATERNISSTAAYLGVSRNTVANRLAVIEARIGRPLSTCATEIESALRLDEVSNQADA
jgi:hypothetical protein